MASNAKTITTTLFDGSVEGFIKAEIEMAWTGFIFAGPRNDERFAKLADIKKKGAYFLVENNAGKPRVYIGQGANVSDRLKKHKKDKDKEFWQRTCIVICPKIKTEDLHYLERSLIKRAEKCRRVKLENKSKPLPKILENSNMDEFMKPIHLIMPMLGFDFFRVSSPKSKPSSGPVASPVSKLKPHVTCELRCSKKKHKIIIKAEGSFSAEDEKFTVFNDSDIYGEVSSGNISLYEETIADKKKVQFEYPGALKGNFLQSVTFNNPSAAASVVLGSSANGNQVWKVKGTNTTLGEWRGKNFEISKL